MVPRMERTRETTTGPQSHRKVGDAAWKRSYGRLLAYATTHGCSSLRSHHVDESGFGLGAWVYAQNRHYAAGTLSAERIELLESVPGWRWKNRRPKFRGGPTWETGLVHLRAHVERTGAAFVTPSHVTEDGFHLGNWVRYVRERYSRADLPPDAAAQLEALPGWFFSARESRFQATLHHLRRHAQATGGAAVERRMITADGFRLGARAEDLRAAYAKGLLPAEQVAALEQIEGWTWDGTRDRRWEENLERLSAYARCHGNSVASLTERYVTGDGVRLGTWVAQQRVARREGRLAPYREALLAAVPGWSWGINGDAWERGMRELVAYVNEHGDADVLSRYVTPDGYRLGKWVRRARFKYSKGLLAPDRVSALEAIAGWVWVADPGPRGGHTDWGFAMGRLRAFAAEHGHTRVPAGLRCSDGFDLGGWVSSAREQYRRGHMPVDHAAQLDALPGWTGATPAVEDAPPRAA
ncbi:hypothetical protein ACT17_06410 [Mycolicibacterium conceptionense]|uniref:Helicase-associated domain-containing protein n=2 Tax=Mycolicibacterium conceptionense TaxID=451644 RepID=A0A0J8X2K3_9MYCO|nr:hypothetical protein ACT17_06410 [Mycolicibacterium conceptionense]